MQAMARLTRARCFPPGLFSAVRRASTMSHDWYLKEILKAFRVYDVAIETALTPARALSTKLGCNMLIKREDMQPVFSFKIRGAYNKIVQLCQEDRDRGVVACSAGNHAQGVAMSCRALGTKAVIIMPRGTPRIKVDAVDVRLHGDAYDDAAAEAKRLVREEGLTLIHPFDDPAVIAGQGTIGMEILRQMAARRLDAIFCCVGGGGLLAGVAAYVKQVRPGVKIYGVEARDAASMTTSLEAGKRYELDRVCIRVLPCLTLIDDTSQVGLFADGAAVRYVGEETFRSASEFVDGMITVENDDICAAIKAAFLDARCVLEPAGALAVAGARKHIESLKVRGDILDPEATFVAVASGANMDFDRLRYVSERADRSEVRLAVSIPEEPGAFRELYSKIYPSNVTEFAYRFNRKGHKADIIVAFQPQTKEWRQDLERAGYKPRDITNDELVSAHVRHLLSTQAGGRAPHVTDERIFRFEFPEAPGALNKFLEELDAIASTIGNGTQGKVNCSLFHYRNYGHDFGRVLVGLQVPTGYVLDNFFKHLGYSYVEETNNPSYIQFLRPSP